ncbi:MAG: type II secretion system F family protein [Kangiellaceae bacterium]|nr:type II secretion system F family protein [Kangiellaceae bacterium]
MNSNNDSNLFLDLATLISAGISIAEAVKRVANSYPQVTEWKNVIDLTSKGSRLSIALRQSKLINQFECELISVSEDAGRIEEGLTTLSESYTKRQQRQRKLKSKLYYPFAVLVVAILVSSLLSALASKESSVMTTLLFIAIKIGLSLYLLQLILKQLKKDACYWLSYFDKHQSQSWYKSHFQQILLRTLYWHTQSGIDPKTSFNRFSKLFDSSILRKQLLKASQLCNQGFPLSNAVRQAQLPMESDVYQVLHSAEQSGQLELSLKNQLELIDFDVDNRIDDIFEWAPRAFYGVVVIFAAAAIIF